MKFKDESVRTITLELTEAEAYELKLDLKSAHDELGLMEGSSQVLLALRSVALEAGK